MNQVRYWQLPKLTNRHLTRLERSLPIEDCISSPLRVLKVLRLPPLSPVLVRLLLPQPLRKPRRAPHSCTRQSVMSMQLPRMATLSTDFPQRQPLKINCDEVLLRLMREKFLKQSQHFRAFRPQRVKQRLRLFSISLKLTLEQDNGSKPARQLRN